MTWLKIEDDHDMLWVDDDAHAMHMINATITLGCYKIFVLPSSKLFAGSPKLRECFFQGKGNNAKINHNGTNEQNKRNNIGIIKYVHPLFCLSCFQVNKSRGQLFLKGGRMMWPYQGNQHSSKHSRWKLNIIPNHLGFHIQGYYLVYMIIDSNTLLSWNKKIAILSQHYKPMC